MPTITNVDVALQLARDKRYEEAVKMFTSILFKNEMSIDIYYYRGCAYLHLGRYKRAIDDFNFVIRSNNSSSKHELIAIYKRAFAYYKANQYARALDDYRLFVNLCENNREQIDLIHKGFFQMGIVNSVTNEYDSAIKSFTKAIETSQDMDEDQQKLYYLHRGRAFACLAKFDQAEQDLQLVIRESNDRFVKGCAYNELGEHQKALNEFNTVNQSKLVQFYPEHVFFRQGLCCASLKQHDQALLHFQTALTHSKRPTSANITDRIFFRKGMSNLEIGQSNQALIDFNESTKFNDTQSDVLYARGMLYYKLGRFDAAAYDQRKAMELERNPPVLTPVPNATSESDQYIDTHLYYENKISEIDELLKRNKNTPNEPILYRDRARYMLRQAESSSDPIVNCDRALYDVKIARHLTGESQTENAIETAIISLYMTHYLMKKYATKPMPEHDLERYIECSVDSILSISKLIDQCTSKEQLNKLNEVLKNKFDQTNNSQTSQDDMLFKNFLSNQIEKIETLTKTIDLFAESLAQQEFYRLLVNRFWTLFEGIRMTSSGIFGQQLEGTTTKMAWAFKLLDKLFEYIPIGSQFSQKVFGIREASLKKFDEIRIQNALNHLGRDYTPTATKDLSNTIAIELTIIYENQIRRFLSSEEEKQIINEETQQQQRPTSWLFTLFSDNELPNMHRIVEFAMSLALSCLMELKSFDINDLDCLQNLFINGICRPPKLIPFQIAILPEKIRPSDAKSAKDYWLAYDFFRRAAIEFENREIRAQKQTDIEKYGCRKATLEEKRFFKTTPEIFDKLGFKTFNQIVEL